MKNNITIIIILLLFSQSNVFSKNYALLIGINEYSSRDWGPLENTINDCKSLEKVLKERYAFEKIWTLYDKKATRANIYQELESLRDSVSENDNLLIYYSGHGYLDVTSNEGFWVPIDSKFSKSYDLISNSDVKNLIKSIEAKHILLIIDACYSGSMLIRPKGKKQGGSDNFYENMMNKKSCLVLTSGGIEVVSDSGGDGHSIFAQCLLNGLVNNKERYLEIGEIFYTLRDLIPSSTSNKQQPQLGILPTGNHGGGSFVFELSNYDGIPSFDNPFDKEILATFRRDTILKIGVVNYKGEDAIRETFGPFATYISEKYKKIPYLEILDYENLSQELSKSEFDIGVFSPFAYIEAKNEFPELNVFAVHQAKGRKGYHGVIAVKRGNGINNLEDLKGKSFLFAHSKSTSGYQYPLKYFREAGIEPDHNFFNYSFSGSHENSIQALSKGEVDGIATYLEAIEDYGANIDASKIQIIYMSNIIPYNAYVFNPIMPESDRKLISKIMFNAHSYPKNQDMFDNRLKIQGWHECNDEFYDNLRDYLKIQRLKQSLKIKVDSASLKELDKIIPAEFLIDAIKAELLQTGRFALDNEKNDGEYLLDLTLHFRDGYVYHNSKFDYKPLLREKMLITDLETQLSLKLCDAILSELVIETTLDYDGKVAFIPFGRDDGIDDNYSVIIYDKEGIKSEQLSSSEIVIRQPDTILPKKYAGISEKGRKVKIIYNKNQ